MKILSYFRYFLVWKAMGKTTRSETIKLFKTNSWMIGFFFFFIIE